MSFFDELTQRAKNVADTAAGKAREVAGSAKISAAILAEKRELNKRYREIGQWYANEYSADDVPESIADVMSAVKASREKIEMLQAERDKAETEEAIAEEEGRVCPVCGRISNDKFCPSCGRPLSEAAAASREEIAAQHAGAVKEAASEETPAAKDSGAPARE